MAEFTKAIKLDPKSAKAYAGRGALKYAMGDSKGAILDLSKAIELNPKSISAYSGRGSAKFAAGDTPGAIADFMSAGRLMLFPISGSDSGSESGKESGTIPVRNPARILINDDPAEADGDRCCDAWLK